MLSYREFVERFAEPRNKIDGRTAGRIRMCVQARLKGWSPADIADWLQVSVHSVRGYLRHVGAHITDRHWQHGGYHCYADRLAALGLLDEHILRTGATRHGDEWYSTDMALVPSARWVERMAMMRRRYQRRQARLAGR